MRLSRKGKIVLAALFLAVVASLALTFFRPLEGRYSGKALDPLSKEAEFFLESGNAYIDSIDGTRPVKYGEYSRRTGEWVLKEGDRNWILKRTILGFDMILATNETVRYRFTRKWFR